ncbi:hypothetical protein H4Q26_006578 [Puccinia striiformis f. sp. tritici PST-130]|nr:hypothetical protein H4Q26_006578 [Puccinia striiformis f. sp. tritici PST-130]
MGLVDYGSSEEEEENQTTTVVVPPKKQQQQKPRKVVIELPRKLDHNEKNGSKEEDLLSKLKRKQPGSSKSSGLASLLPPPKRTQTQTQTSSSSSSLLLKPKTLAKTKDEDDSSSAVQPEPSSSTVTLNLFGLAPPIKLDPSASLSKSSSLVASTDPKNSITISSAPLVTEELPPPPRLLDPYPGYWQRKDGTWVKRDDNEPIWKAFYLQHYSHQSNKLDIPSSSRNQKDNNLPKDFFRDAPINSTNKDGGGLVEFDAKKVAQNAWENKPKIIDPREEARLEQEVNQVLKPARRKDKTDCFCGGKQKQISSRARGRHQLTSLLTDAQSNRAELEDRISRGKFNRKAGGAKYGSYFYLPPFSICFFLICRF